MSGPKALPPVYLFVAIVAMVALHFMAPVWKYVPSPWNLVGIVPLALGIALNLVAANAFRVRETTIKPFEESTALVTSGAFRVTRNPIYLGMALLLLGLALLMGSLTPFAPVVVFAVLMDRLFIPVEETMLETKFGEEWREYREKVRRWI